MDAAFTLLIMLITSFHYARTTEQLEEGNINHLVDAIIPEVVKIIRNENVEPIWLSNLDQKELSQCQLQGVTTIYRSGDCTWRQINPQQISINAHIGFAALTGSCHISKRILFFEYKGVIRMRMNSVTSSLVILQNSDSLLANNSNPRLQSLDVCLEQGVVIETEGDSALTFVLDTLKFVYIRRLQRLVRDNLRQQFTHTLTHHLNQINSWTDLHPLAINTYNATSTF